MKPKISNFCNSRQNSYLFTSTRTVPDENWWSLKHNTVNFKALLYISQVLNNGSCTNLHDLFQTHWREKYATFVQISRNMPIRSHKRVFCHDGNELRLAMLSAWTRLHQHQKMQWLRVHGFLQVFSPFVYIWLTRKPILGVLRRVRFWRAHKTTFWQCYWLIWIMNTGSHTIYLHAVTCYCAMLQNQQHLTYSATSEVWLLNF